jgi:hypothetical protein
MLMGMESVYLCFTWNLRDEVNWVIGKGEIIICSTQQPLNQEDLHVVWLLAFMSNRTCPSSCHVFCSVPVLGTCSTSSSVSNSTNKCACLAADEIEVAWNACAGSLLL